MRNVLKAMLISSVGFTTGEISGRIHDPAAYIAIAIGVTVCYALSWRWFGKPA